MKKKVMNWTNVLVLAAMLLCECASNGSTMQTHRITLAGSASGGVLTLVGVPQGRHVSITTKPGESAESVAMRLVSAINESDPFKWWDGKVDKTEDDRIHVTGNSVELPGSLGSFAFAGTEKGLGIPMPPLSLSCSYHLDKDRIFLHWVNPPGGYDEIRLLRGPFALTGRGRPGTLTSYIIDRKGRDVSDMIFSVVGVRGDIPSNAAAIHLSHNTQDELFNIPFSNCVAPNWSSWSTNTKTAALKFKQGTKVSQRKRSVVRKPKDKLFFQLIKVNAPAVKAGVWRKFLGLTPGHTYRVSARLNTLEMDSAQKGWSFSLHAAYNKPGRTDLTVGQLSGSAALPDGSVGLAAGRIAHYGPQATTNRKWLKSSTEITLPAGVDSITVWVRHSDSDSTGVGIDWVKLEDLSMMSDKSGK